MDRSRTCTAATEARSTSDLAEGLSSVPGELAREAGFGRINVISSVGTRDYYRKLGFVDGALYQTREL